MGVRKKGLFAFSMLLLWMLLFTEQPHNLPLLGFIQGSTPLTLVASMKIVPQRTLHLPLSQRLLLLLRTLHLLLTVQQLLLRPCLFSPFLLFLFLFFIFLAYY